MRIQFQALITVAVVGVVAASIPALSRPNPNGLEQDTRSQSAARIGAKPLKNGKVANHNSAHKAKGKKAKKRVVYRPGVQRAAIAQASLVPVDDRYGNYDPLVAEARRYVGTNPTEMSRRWCARFMNMVLNKLGYAGTGSDAARSFASYGRRVSEPRVGAIAVLSRGKSQTQGHVGVVSGLDARGNPIIVSGNHGRRVAESVYPRARVIAYVMPTEKGRTMLAAGGDDLPDLGQLLRKVGNELAFVGTANAEPHARGPLAAPRRDVRAAAAPRAERQIAQVERGPAQRTAQLRAPSVRSDAASAPRGEREKKPEFALAVEATMARMLNGR